MSGQLASESARLLIALGCLKFVTLLSASSKQCQRSNITSHDIICPPYVLQDRCCGCEAQINAPLKFYI